MLSTSAAALTGAVGLARPTSPGPPAATPGTADRAAVHDAGRGGVAGAVADLLDRRAAAVRSGDRAAWLATLDTRDASFVAAQSELFTRLQAVAPTAWRYEVISLRQGPASGELVVAARLALRLSPDTRDTTRDQVVTVALAADGSRHLVRSVTGSAGAAQDLWDVAPVSVRVGARGLVIAAGSDPASSASPASPAEAAIAEQAQRDLDAAAAAVDQVWGTGWPREAVVVLPATAAQASAVLGPRAAAVSGLAALTTGEVETGEGQGRVPSGTADRIVLNPDVASRLTPAGRLVVLRHELTHVATRATSALTPPLWLQEGFASWVGYLGSGLPDRVVAADALGAPQDLPAHLPLDGDFTAAPARTVAGAYAQAWVACDLIVRDHAERGLVDFYRTAAAAGSDRSAGDAPAALARAFTQVLGRTQEQFEAQWRARLLELAKAR